MFTLAFVVFLANAQATPPAESGVSDKSNDRIQAVVDTLDDLLKSIEDEEVKEEANYQCLEKWCEKEVSNIGQAVEDGGIALEDLDVSIDQHKSTIDRNTFASKKNEEEITEINDALAQATSIRDEENEKYLDERQANSQSTQQIRSAIKIVKKAQAAGGFIQGEMKTQLSGPGESGFVLGVFEGLEKKLVSNQQKTDAVENEKRMMYDNLHGGKTQQLNIVKDDLRTKNMLMSEAKQKLTDSKNDLLATTASHDANIEAHEDATAECEEQARAWDIKTQDRQAEKAAIREATSYLTLTMAGSAPAPVFFAQVRSSSTSLSTLSRDLTSLAATTGTNGKNDAFKSVKDVINELITVIVAEQAAEKSKNDWCLSETEKNEKLNATKTDDLERMAASIAKSKSLVEMLTTSKESLNASLTEQDVAEAVASKLRGDQKHLYESGSKDRLLAVKVLTQATAVLTAFYESKEPALIETNGPMPDVGASERHTGESNVVLAMLAKLTDDIRREEKHAADEEEKLSAAHEQYRLDCRHNFDSTMMEITEKVTRRARLQVRLESSSEDHEADSDSLSALQEKFSAISLECKEVVDNYDKREKARKFEADQLRDAYDILSGSQVAARTAFLAAERSFLQEKTTDRVLKQLQSVSRSVGAFVEKSS